MPTTHTLHVDGHQIQALALNPGADGQPVILLHGVGGSVRFWTADQIAPFLEQGPCYALSLPGHHPGSFPPHFQREQFTPALLAHVLAAAIRQLVGGRPVLLVGHSTGGFAALATAARVPGLAQRVISVSGFAQGCWIGALGACQWLACRRPASLGDLLFKGFYTLGGLNRISRAVFYQAWRVYMADAEAAYAYPYLHTCIDACYGDFARHQFESIAHYFAVLPSHDISDLLPHIRVPTLAITGDRDPIVPPAQSRLISSRVPAGDLVVLEGGGHLLFAERPQAYQRALCDWLQATTPHVQEAKAAAWSVV